MDFTFYYKWIFPTTYNGVCHNSKSIAYNFSWLTAAKESSLNVTQMKSEMGQIYNIGCRIIVE